MCPPLNALRPRRAVAQYQTVTPSGILALRFGCATVPKEDIVGQLYRYRSKADAVIEKLYEKLHKAEEKPLEAKGSSLFTIILFHEPFLEEKPLQKR